ncbi:MAG: DUF190 domain-containing protein [Candidatus Acidiferrales bacterium]
MTENLPIKIEFIESHEKVEELLPKLHEMAGTGLIEVQGTMVVKPAQLNKKAELRGEQAPALKREGKAKLTRVYVGESDKWHGQPLYKAIVEKCRELDIAGATVYRGIEGYGASTIIRRSHLLSVSHDAPIMVSIVDAEDKVRKLIPAPDAMVDEGLIAMSDVEVIKYVHQEGARS